jgi:hypothetical protein
VRETGRAQAAGERVGVRSRTDSEQDRCEAGDELRRTAAARRALPRAVAQGALERGVTLDSLHADRARDEIGSDGEKRACDEED